MTPETRTLRAHTDPREAQRQLAIHFDSPEASVRGTAGAEDTNVTRFTLQVVDRLGNPWARVGGGRWLVFVYISPTEHGDPSATGNTVAFVTGTVVQTIVAHSTYLVLTDADGLIELDVTVAGAAVRVAHAMVVGPPEPGQAGEWT